MRGMKERGFEPELERWVLAHPDSVLTPGAAPPGMLWFASAILAGSW